MGYLILIFFFGIIPSILLLYFARNYFNWKAFGITVFIVFVAAFISDYIGIEKELWTYGISGTQTIGKTVFGVPIEDLIFFLTIPPWIIGSYELLKAKFSR
ncbi:MAG: lycopene cyclase domain-containing protein [bacterium]|nr:lycopene cyclase domain-containing protein [bacterium]